MQRDRWLPADTSRRGFDKLENNGINCIHRYLPEMFNGYPLSIHYRPS